MYRIIDEAGNKYRISKMQGDGTITYILHSKMYIQKATSQYNETSDWEDETLLYRNYIFNY